MGCGNSKMKGDTFDGIDAMKPAQKVNFDQLPSGNIEMPSSDHQESIDDGRTANPTNLRELAPQAPRNRTEDLDPVREMREGDEETNTSSPPMPAAKTSKIKKPGLYARYQAKKKGPGEPRDPETGRGLYTGMTKEEIMKYVPATRRAGLFGHGDAFGGKGNGTTALSHMGGVSNLSTALV